MLARNDPARPGALQRQKPAVSAPIDDFDDDLDGGPEVPEEQEQQRPGPPAKPLVKRAPQRRKPQLTIVDLKKPDGLAYVFSEFPKQFAAGFKGKGHEVRDLRRLLEMYQRWQRRLFPHGSFQDFQEKLEKIGVKCETRDELHAMRTRLYTMVQPPQPQPGLEEEEGQQAGAAADAAGSSDDDYLQQKQQQQPGLSPLKRGSSSPAGAAAGPGGYDMPDDDELMEMQLDAQWDAADEAFQDAWEPDAAAAPAPAASMGPPPSSVAPTAAATTRMSGAPHAAAATSGGGDEAPASVRRKRPLADWSDDEEEDMPAQPPRKAAAAARDVVTAVAAASTPPAGPAGGSSPAAAAGGEDGMGGGQAGLLTDSLLDQLLQETQLDAAAELEEEDVSQPHSMQPGPQHQPPEVHSGAVPAAGLDEEELEALLQDTAQDGLDYDAPGATAPLGVEQQQQQVSLAGTSSLQVGDGELSETQLQQLLEPTNVDQPMPGEGRAATPPPQSQPPPQEQVAEHSEQQQTQPAADQHMLALLDDDFDDDE